ncbi:SEL1-like repeat protein [Pseudomonas sp.]|uniref:SEL1-like repeat protein n=1 Tax=Pseudomonas sp. TaxID=306 RepID=UPI003D6DAD6A
MRLFLLLTILLLTACGPSDTSTYSKKENPLNPLTEIKAKLTFTCAHETIPESPSDADILFQHARWLQKNNQLKQDKSIDAQIERLYRIAAEHDHYKSNINLQNGAIRGHFRLRGAEYLRLSQNLIEANVATGYYFIAIFLQQGAAGLKQDPQMALRYYRKAADHGNAEAQYYLADKLAPDDIAPAVSRQMRRCAAEQGQGRAATILSIYLQDEKKYSEALEVLQMGAAAGYESAAGRLKEAFSNPPPSDEMYYLGQQEDLERAKRYEKIWNVLADYSYAYPKVPEINEIVPLPPAKLPAWDGKLQWLEERLANVPPPKPSEALIRELAKAKQLDSATGRPMPESPAFIKVAYPAPTCDSGQPCPHSGYWEATGYFRHLGRVSLGETRRFKQGEILPTLVVRRNHSRLWPLPDRTTVGEEKVKWVMLGEA